jgi:hypothetical protein
MYGNNTSEIKKLRTAITNLETVQLDEINTQEPQGN